MTVSIHLVRALALAVERAGVPRGEYLERADLTEAHLLDSVARFAMPDFGKLQALALDLSRDEALGLHLAEHVTEAAFDVVGHLVSHAPTLREAVNVISQFGSLVLSDFALELSERVDVAGLTYRFPRLSARQDRMHAEFIMAGMVRLMREFVGRQAEPHSVHFEHPAPAYRCEYTRIFGGKECFSRPETSVYFPRAWLDAQQMHKNEHLSALLRAEARRVLETAGSTETFTERVARYLRAHPKWRIPGMDDAARHLGTSVRSLRRRLTEEGVSYRQLVNAALQDTASELLRDPQLSVTDAALASGYSEVTAFHRAFKRWTGVTPKQFRRVSH